MRTLLRQISPALSAIAGTNNYLIRFMQVVEVRRANRSLAYLWLLSIPVTGGVSFYLISAGMRPTMMQVSAVFLSMVIQYLLSQYNYTGRSVVKKVSLITRKADLGSLEYRERGDGYWDVKVGVAMIPYVTDISPFLEAKELFGESMAPEASPPD